MFLRNLLPPFSLSKRKPCKQPARKGRRTSVLVKKSREREAKETR
jgi:hypothetical protein